MSEDKKKNHVIFSSLTIKLEKKKMSILFFLSPAVLCHDYARLVTMTVRER